MGTFLQAMKTYQICDAESASAEAKFRIVEAQKAKFEADNPSKLGSRKHKFLDKEFEKVPAPSAQSHDGG